MTPRSKPTVVVDNTASLPPQSGHNQVLDMDFEKYTYLKNAIITAEAVFDEADGAAKAKKKLVTKARKTFEANGGSLAEYDFIREICELKDPEKSRARLARMALYMGYEGVSLPETIGADVYDKVPDKAKEEMLWYERGRMAANTGTGVFANQFPEGCPLDMTQHWARGVLEEQEAIAARMARAGPLFDLKDAPIIDEEDEGGEGNPDADDDDSDRDDPDDSDEAKPVDWQESPGEHLAQAEIDRMAQEGGHD